MTMSFCAGINVMAMCQLLSFDGVCNFFDTLFGDDLHVKWVKFLVGVTLGVMYFVSLVFGLIG